MARTIRATMRGNGDPNRRNPKCCRQDGKITYISGKETHPVKRHITEEKIPLKQTWHGHSAFRIKAGEAKISIDPFLCDNPSRGGDR